MKKKHIITGVAILAILVSASALWFFTKGKPSVSVGREFSNYIAAHTSGIISSRESIQVVFATDVSSPENFGQPAESRLLRIRPSVKGSLIWYNERTLEFIPENPLEGDREFTITVALNRIFKDIPRQYNEFVFSVRTIRQALEVEIDGLAFYDDPGREDRRISGRIRTADFADPQKLQTLVKAEQGNRQLEMSWEVSDDSRIHSFWIEGVNQGETPGQIRLSVNGRPLGAELRTTLEVEVPAKGDFRLLSHNVVQAPEQFLELRFSEPLDPSQNLRGLITASGSPEIRMVIEGNLVKIFPTTRLTGAYTFEISEGVRNIHRKRLEQPSTVSVTFEVLKPQVRLVGQGVIMPSSGGLLFPFQAVSLRAVDVSIVKIFEQNIAQFLQVNNLSGQSELRRTGRTILRRTILLDQAGPVDFNTWNTYHIDLAKLIQTEPGAIYQVTIDFRPNYSTFHCDGQTNQEPIEIIEQRHSPSDDVARTYYYDDYYDDYYYDYDWRERDNPCHPSYYRNRAVRRNFLASDLGMIAKGGTDGSFTLAITDLNTAQPIQGVSVELLNFQQMVIARATTNNQGLAEFSLREDQVPFLAIAKSGSQRGYLKIDRGSALSVSSFDVSGVAVQRGLKGFLYGERGVWRPGDTLFISFMLEDKGKVLPAGHPITFELTNPRGTLVHRAIANQSSAGIYAFPVATERDAPTGNYTARIRAGGASFSQVFKVETIMPNRLKILFNIQGDAIRHGRAIQAQLQSNWLHGAPARNLKVKVDAILSQASTAFEGFAGFSFDDPARTFQAEEQTVFEGTLDANGLVTFTPRISVSKAAPGRLNAHFTTRVFEEGGAFSIDRFTLPYYPYETYVGIRMPESSNRRNSFLTDTTHVVQLVSLNSEGRPAPRRTLNIEVYKIDWRWWWERRTEDLSNYIASSYHRPVQRAQVTTDNNGRANWNLRINNPEWGRFLIRVVDANGGHAAGTTIYMDWPGWVSRDRRSTPEAASMLVFSSDKEKYNVGESIQLTIPTPSRGKIFLTVENGVKVLQTHWIDAQAGETRFNLVASDKMAPNVYIHAMLLQPHGQTANDLPIRMYGIVPVGVEDPQTHLTPVITMPDVLEPEQNVSITVSEKDGRPMAFTLAVVDDGLLDLTRFGTPNPWATFYAREALGVNSWDLYDMVLGATTGRMQRILAIGGDEELLNQGDRTADRFKPVVRFFGPYEIGRGRRERIDFTMPNYVGSVRVMAIAARDGAYGSAEKTVPVRKPLMVLGTLPRVLGPEEDVVLPVTVFAMDPGIRNVKVRVETNDMLSISGSREQTLRFDNTGDQVVRFQLSAAARLGIGKVKITAESGRERAVYEIELDVRNANPPITIVQDTLLGPGARWSTSYRAPGLQGTNTASIELSTLPPVNLGKRLRFLLGYPHGCLEQTVSKAFPQLFISKLAEVEDRVKQESEQNVRAALASMRRFRTSEGGFSLWPGGTYPDEWATIYAGHFMLEARKLGYTLPAGVLDGWLRSTQRAARNWSPAQQSNYAKTDLIQAYRLYVLALANSAEMGAMNRLRESSRLTPAARWRLAAAYALAGNPEAARNLLSGVSPQINPYRELAHTYGSHIRDKAMIVETFVLLNDFDKAMPLLREISEVLASDQWMSTQETSFSLLAFSKFAEGARADRGIDASVAIHGRSAQRQRTDRSLLHQTFEPAQSGQERIEITNNGQGSLFARLITHGIPTAGQEVAQSNHLQLEVTYRLMNGNPVNPARITQGTDFYADIRVVNPGTRGNLEQLILSFVVPSGWEIRDSRLDEGQQALQSSPFQYQDIRDDRVYTYFDLQRGTTKSFRIRFNAAYEGRYYMPGVSCEAMYDNTINARNTGAWVEVALP
ncbi:MAG: alpha-2-macroglobulin family protein [Bacteroidales bacterium]